MSAGGRLTCRDAMLCVRRAIWMFGLALCILSVALAPGQALEDSGLAYVVSPPPATRQMMPNYLPKLPPENSARIPQLAAHSVRRLRPGCRSCQLRPRHVRRCTRCRHRTENSGASRHCRHAGHCAYHRRGGFEQHRRHLPRQHGIVVNGSNRQDGDHRHAPRRRRRALSFPGAILHRAVQLEH